MSSPLTVLQVIPTMARKEGGPAEVVRQLHRHLSKLDVESRIVTTDLRLEDPEDLASLPHVTVTRSRPPRRYSFSPGIGGAISSEVPRAHVVHVHSVDTYSSTVATRIAARFGKPVVLQPHGAYDPYHREQNALIKKAYLNLIDRRIFARAEAIVGSSTREAEGIERALGRSPIIIPLGVDPYLLDLERNPSASPFVLFLGRLTKKKSVDLAIQGFAESRVSEKGVRLVVAGPLDPRLDYDPVEVARRAGVESHVEFLGEVGSVQRADLLAAATAFILPSEDESFGVSVAEAMAAGCVVISSPEVGLVPAAGRAGALVETPRNPTAIGLAIGDLLRDARRLKTVSDAARQYARERYDWEGISREFSELYRNVAGKGHN